MPRKGIKKIEVRTALINEFEDDKILHSQLMKVMAMAAEIANMSPEDAEKYQRLKWRK